MNEETIRAMTIFLCGITGFCESTREHDLQRVAGMLSNEFPEVTTEASFRLAGIIVDRVWNRARMGERAAA